MEKLCSKCLVMFPATTEFFHPNEGGKFGLRGQCITCRNASVRDSIRRPEISAKRKAYEVSYVESGRSAAAKKLWRARNIEKCLASKRVWKSKNQERCRLVNLSWRERNRDKARAKQRRADARLQTIPSHVLKKRIKARIRAAVMRRGSLSGLHEFLGYTSAQLIEHIEKQFVQGMDWSALMRGEIHIDHITPVSSFKIEAIGDLEFKRCWGLPNLRPLWAIDNLRKRAVRTTLL